MFHQVINQHTTFWNSSAPPCYGHARSVCVSSQHQTGVTLVESHSTQGGDSGFSRLGYSSAGDIGQSWTFYKVLTKTEKIWK